MSKTSNYSCYKFQKFLTVYDLEHDRVTRSSPLTIISPDVQKNEVLMRVLIHLALSSSSSRSSSIYIKVYYISNFYIFFIKQCIIKFFCWVTIISRVISNKLQSTSSWIYIHDGFKNYMVACLKPTSKLVANSNRMICKFFGWSN